MPLEIERKYLLKDIPNRAPDQRLEIKQYYCEDKKHKRNFRLRETVYWTNDGMTRNVEYFETTKKFISPGIYEEHEISLNKGAFDDMMKYAKSSISKTRYIYKINKKLKWEVDVFNNMRLVVAEIEIPDMAYKFSIPKYIKDVLLMEVTEFTCFTNKNLAKSYGK
jgi:CYTH domain-containing protein